MPKFKGVRRLLANARSLHTPIPPKRVAEATSEPWITTARSWILITFFPLQLLAVALVLSKFREDEPAAIYVAVLFALPPLLQVVGIILIQNSVLRIFYSGVSLLSSGSYLSCWIYYSVFGQVKGYVSGICLVLTALLVLLAFFIAMATFRIGTAFSGKSKRLFSRVANEIGTSPSGEILFFLAFFVCVAYLISFSLVFDDQYRTTHGLLPGLRSDTVIDSEIHRGRGSEYSLQESELKKWFVMFRAASAKVEAGLGEGLDSERLSQRDYEVRKHNSETLEQITRFLKGVNRRRTIRITLIGRTADAFLPKRSEFGSNYELAEARSQAVKLVLQDLLLKEAQTLPSFEWVIVPLSESSDVPTEKQQAVEVLVQPLLHNSQRDFLEQSSEEVRLLTLIEYIYFGMYTITTTGYGDLKPASSYAMFVCTLANFYAVFFLVIFFNVLLSPKRRRIGKLLKPQRPPNTNPSSK